MPGDVCERGYLVEDFGLPLNLMLACAAKIVQGGPAACLRAISEAYDAYEGGTTAPLPGGKMADRRFARCRVDASSVYKVLNAMNESHLWVAEPHAAYLHWQTTEAAGADRRRFSHRSIVQHKAMFDRFLRHLVTRGAALATFGPEHLESFFDDVQNRCAPGTTTRLRYVKLIDRLCRHLVDVGLRHSNPAATFALSAAWPKDEPEPLFLDTDADTALQGYVQPDAGDDARLCRSEAHASRGLCPFPPSRRLRSRHGNGFIRRPTARFFSPRRAQMTSRSTMCSSVRSSATHWMRSALLRRT